MQLVHVIPIARGIGRETLSYFSARPLKKGVVVSVPLRKKEVPAIVLSTEDIGSAKTKIKSSRFAIKKITSRKSIRLYSPEFIVAARNAADFFVSTTGFILNSMTPKTILEHALKSKSWSSRQSTSVRNAVSSRQIVFQAEREDRYTRYKSLVREEFAKGNSVFILVPTIQDAEKINAFLRKGIEQYIVLLHSALPKKESVARWKKAMTIEHPILIIATGTFLSLSRADLKTVIVEKEGSRAYKMPKRPFIDLRVFAQMYAKQIGAQLIFADLPLQVDTIWRYRDGELDELAPLKLRSFRNAKQIIVDMRHGSKQKIKKFEVLSEELRALIKKTYEEGKRMFVFSARRGLSPVTICRDCGNIVSCEICHAPLVLHRSPKVNIFVCHHCGVVRSAKERCKHCSSWRLDALGIGIQFIESEIKEHYKDAPLFMIDRDATGTNKKALDEASKFYDTKGSVLLGTEMALPFLSEKVEYSAIASMDSFLSLPDWRMPERILSILLSIRDVTLETLLIQTRKPDSDILDIANRGNLTDFYKKEIEQREALKYPPFSALIKITTIGTPAGVQREIENLKKKLRNYSLSIYPPMVPISKGKYAMHGLIKIPRKEWPNRELLNILYSLPPNITVDVNPESLL
jgi:primosomal protein N' (replication factor Y) (superfamily II helicase)